MATLADIRQRVIDHVKDDSQRLVRPDDYDRNITAALSRYSRHRPALQVVDVTGNGGHDYDLPSGWVGEFSVVRSIEYPVGDVPATILDSDDYEIYRTPSGEKLRLVNHAPSASESFRVAFTVMRTAATVPDGDVDAFVWLAAALCCEELANAFAQSGDSTISADAVDYQSKSREFASRARRLKQLYKEHLGLKDDDLTPPASAVVDLDMKYPGGGERLTHRRSLRERR